MKRFSGQKDDPFIISSERIHDHQRMDEVLHVHARDSRLSDEKKAKATATGPWETENPKKGQKTIGGFRDKARQELMRQLLLQKLLGAIVGGTFLVAPMWAFTLHKHVFFLLGGTTICVFLFGIFTTFLVNNPGEVFAATLAYAAVLMVFVGVMMQESGT